MQYTWKGTVGHLYHAAVVSSLFKIMFYECLNGHSAKSIAVLNAWRQFRALMRMLLLGPAGGQRIIVLTA